MSAIHIVYSAQNPDGMSIVTALCGEHVRFGNAIAVSWDDGRVCESCLTEHRQNFRDGLHLGRSIHTWGIPVSETQHSQ